MHDPSVLIWRLRGVPLTRKSWKRWRSKWGFRPTLFECWHDEPGGRDSGSVCDRSKRKWHVTHLRVKFIPWRDFKHRFVRCYVCNRRMNTAARFACGWERGKVGHLECTSAEGYRAERPLQMEIVHRLLLHADLHTEEQVREALSRPHEQRDQFLVWYRAWKMTEHYRAEADQWVAPNQHMSKDPVLRELAEAYYGKRKEVGHF